MMGLIGCAENGMNCGGTEVASNEPSAPDRNPCFNQEEQPLPLHKPDSGSAQVVMGGYG